MTAAALASPRSLRRRAVLLALSAGLHVAVLGGLALRGPAESRMIAVSAIDVSLVPGPPIAHLPRAAPAPQPSPLRGRAVLLQSAPRYAGSPQADTGEASDAVDLFGPVFADGHWPRPMLVRNEPCDPDADRQRALPCRREFLLIGLASDAAAGSKAEP